jgi:hypothetical protein
MQKKSRALLAAPDAAKSIMKQQETPIKTI